MIDPAAVPEVTDEELLARFVMQSKHVRRSNLTVRPDAFIPHPRHDLSVSRHLHATEAELWSLGEDVARQVRKTLYGRADVSAAICVREKLIVKAAALANNPNHADISGWPANYDAQKAIALEIAAAAQYIDRT